MVASLREFHAQLESGFERPRTKRLVRMGRLIGLAGIGLGWMLTWCLGGSAGDRRVERTVLAAPPLFHSRWAEGHAKAFGSVDDSVGQEVGVGEADRREPCEEVVSLPPSLLGSESPPEALAIEDEPPIVVAESPRQARSSRGVLLERVEDPRQALEDPGPEVGLTLDQALEWAGNFNPDLAAARLELPRAQADLVTASLRLNPTLGFQTDLIPYERFNDQRPGGQTEYRLGLRLPLDPSGKRFARIGVAQEGVRLAEAVYFDRVRLTLDQTATAFVEVLGARAAANLAQVRFDQTMQAERLLEIQFEQGEATRADRLAARVDRRAAEAARESSRVELIQTQRRLNRLLGRPSDSNPNADPDALDPLTTPRGPLLVEPTPIADLATLRTLAAERRPDLIARRIAVEQARAQVDLERANGVPNWEFAYDPLVYQDNAPFGDLSARSFLLGLSIPLPLFNRNQGNISRALTTLDQARAELVALERQVDLEVEQAFREYNVAVSVAQELLDGLGELDLARRDVLRLVIDGERDPLSYLATLRNFADVAEQTRRAVLRQRLALIRVFTVTGSW